MSMPSQPHEPEPPSWRPQSSDELMGFYYDELRALARGYMAGEAPNHTLQPTALVNEAYARLVKRGTLHWEQKRQFIAAFCRSMKVTLIDHARRKGREWRGGGRRRVSLTGDALYATPSFELLELDEALDKLSLIDRQSSRVATLRLFGNCTFKEIAETLGISETAAKREWSIARAWLVVELSKGDSRFSQEPPSERRPLASD